MYAPRFLVHRDLTMLLQTTLNISVLDFQSTINKYDNGEEETVMNHALFQVSTIPGAIYPTVPTIPVVCGAEG